MDSDISEILKLTRQSDVVVLGAGIIGITQALVMQALGLKVCVIANYKPEQAAAEKCPPSIATGFAMASAYPHNLRIAELELVSAETQNVFASLASEVQSGVETHRIFEVFESEPAAPPLGDKRMGMQYFEGKPQDFKHLKNPPPIRTGAEHIWGWSFDTYFADMPIYLDFLWKQFQAQGGHFVCIDITTELLERLDGLVFDCLGLGARQLFGDTAPVNVMRGKQVLAPGALRVRQNKTLVAFNYTPTADVFSRADGGPEYVHFFSRADGWLLGQTREPGQLDSDGLWTGETVTSPEISIGDLSIPKPIIDLNADLLKSWLGVEFPKDPQLVSRMGYRFYRDSDNTGVRLEIDPKSGPQNSTARIVHNYGHGGSGITMSWGSALAAARLVKDEIAEKSAHISQTASLPEFEETIVRLWRHQAAPIKV